MAEFQFTAQSEHQCLLLGTESLGVRDAGYEDEQGRAPPGGARQGPSLQGPGGLHTERGGGCRLSLLPCHLLEHQTPGALEAVLCCSQPRAAMAGPGDAHG